jgi:hypothetical protein
MIKHILVTAAFYPSSFCFVVVFVLFSVLLKKASFNAMNCFSMVLKTSPMHMSFFNQIISSSNKYLTSFLKLRRNVRQVALFGARNFRELRNITVALFRAPSGGKP